MRILERRFSGFVGWAFDLIVEAAREEQFLADFVWWAFQVISEKAHREMQLLGDFVLLLFRGVAIPH